MTFGLVDWVAQEWYVRWRSRFPHGKRQILW